MFKGYIDGTTALSIIFSSIKVPNNSLKQQSYHAGYIAVGQTCCIIACHNYNSSLYEWRPSCSRWLSNLDCTESMHEWLWSWLEDQQPTLGLQISDQANGNVESCFLSASGQSDLFVEVVKVLAKVHA